jgi:hydrogenase expression/formation protein HypC
MCLAIPGKLITTEDRNGMRMGRANFGGIVKEVCLEYTPDANCGDYVLVHVGFALGKVDEAEARRTYEALAALNQLNDLETPELLEQSDAAVVDDRLKPEPSNLETSPLNGPATGPPGGLP